MICAFQEIIFIYWIWTKDKNIAIRLKKLKLIGKGAFINLKII